MGSMRAVVKKESAAGGLTLLRLAGLVLAGGFGLALAAGATLPAPAAAQGVPGYELDPACGRSSRSVTSGSPAALEACAWAPTTTSSS